VKKNSALFVDTMDQVVEIVLEKHLKFTVVLAAIICLLAAGNFAKTKIVEASKPVYTVLLPYDTYMGNLWQVRQLPDIIRV